MGIKTVFRDIYVNLAERVLLFAKSLIQKPYGESMYLASKLFFNSVSDMELAKARFAVS
jgi:hypothetical protein